MEPRVLESLEKEVCDMSQEHYLTRAATASVLVTHSRSQWRSHGRRARWDVGPKADATTNQFPPRHKVCSRCREFGDATLFRAPLPGRTVRQQRAVSPHACVP